MASLYARRHLFSILILLGIIICLNLVLKYTIQSKQLTDWILVGLLLMLLAALVVYFIRSINSQLKPKRVLETNTHWKLDYVRARDIMEARAQRLAGQPVPVRIEEKNEGLGWIGYFFNPNTKATIKLTLDEKGKIQTEVL